MQIVRIKLSDIKPYEGNAKLHPEHQIEQIMKSIEEFGNNDPIAVDEDHVIIEGHGRYEALKRLGRSVADCVVLKGMTEDQKNAYRLVHNKLTMNSGFDLEALEKELENLSIDLSDFDFGNIENSDWFQSGDRGEAREGEDEYGEFLDKFEAKHTTDDCYTPEKVYEAVAKFVSGRYGIKESKFVRPFYPGGDYKNEKYPKGSAVVDNPPFSILSEIISFYGEKGIKFFLFCPALTPFSGSASKYATVICTGSDITYANGANVSTSFVTNMEEGDIRAMTSHDLYEAVKKANDETLKENRKEIPVYSFPNEVVTAAIMCRFSKYGAEMSIPRAKSEPINALDAMKEEGKGIFGKGLLLSVSLAAEKAAAEKAAATRWPLSEREKQRTKELDS